MMSQTKHVLVMLKNQGVRCLSLSARHMKQSSVRSIRKPDRGNFSEGGYILLFVPIATFGLGTWQVKRRRWKMDLLDDLETRQSAQPIPLPEDLSTLSSMEYTKVKVRGSFDHSQESYIGPRSLLSTVSEQGGGLISTNRSSIGTNVITAFKLSGSNMRILVNRGWVPKNRLDPRTRPEGQVEGEVELVGVVRLTEKRQQFAPKLSMQRNTHTRRDLDQLSAELDTEQIFLDADFESTIEGGPIGGQTRVALRNEHFSYIITWYSLSAITFAMWYKKYWLRKG